MSPKASAAGASPPVFVIAGATASGKTAAAVAAARELDAELVGADSMQVYRGMDIGTATPDEAELGGVLHHMINIVDPSEPYDTAAFSRDADSVINGVTGRGKRVILVGGTGLYIRVLLKGLQSGPPPDAEIRARISELARKDGWPALHEQLRTRDPETHARLHPNDGVRILRALEVHEQTGTPISEWQRDHAFAEARYPFEMVAIERSREDLSGRIDARLEQMMDLGFLTEVEALLAAGNSRESKPMQGLGYKRLCEHLAGETTLSEAMDRVRSDTRRLAKRQRTWFNGEKSSAWIDADNRKIIETASKFFVRSEG